MGNTFGSAAMATDFQPLTADDVLALPVPDHLLGYEFVDGRLVPVTPSSPLHGSVTAEVIRRLGNHVIEHGLTGQVYHDAAFVLDLPHDRERMRGPDAAYVSREKIEAHGNPERVFRCVPDFVIEIDLTSARKPGGRQRIVDYVEAGVPLVWSLDPHSRTGMAFRPDGSARLYRPAEVMDAGDVVPGFLLRLSELFG